MLCRFCQLDVLPIMSNLRQVSKKQGKYKAFLVEKSSIYGQVVIVAVKLRSLDTKTKASNGCETGTDILTSTDILLG